MSSKTKYILFFVLSAIVGAINGIFGGGGGILCIPVLKKLLNLNDKQAHATAVMVMGLISLPTLIVYISTLQFDWLPTILVTVGSLIGGLVGVKLLNKLSNKALNICYIILLLLCAVKSFF